MAESWARLSGLRLEALASSCPAALSAQVPLRAKGRACAACPPPSFKPRPFQAAQGCFAYAAGLSYPPLPRPPPHSCPRPMRGAGRSLEPHLLHFLSGMWGGSPAYPRPEASRAVPVEIWVEVSLCGLRPPQGLEPETTLCLPPRSLRSSPWPEPSPFSPSAPGCWLCP